MRLTKHRIAPVTDEEISDEARAAMGPQIASGPIFNIFRTMLRAPEAIKPFLHWGGYILHDKKNTIAPREREIIILRTGFNWKAGYEWGQHVVIGKRCGLTDQEIEAIKVGPTAANWTPLESAMLQAVDELTVDSFITDATWAALSDLTERQKMDLVYTVGQYTQVSMVLNSFGVQLDKGLPDDPDLHKKDQGA